MPVYWLTTHGVQVKHSLSGYVLKLASPESSSVTLHAYWAYASVLGLRSAGAAGFRLAVGLL